MKRNLNYELMLEFIKRVNFKERGEVFSREDFEERFSRLDCYKYGLRSLYNVGSKSEMGWDVWSFSDRFNKFMNYCESKNYCKKVGRGKWEMLFSFKEYFDLKF